MAQEQIFCQSCNVELTKFKHLSYGYCLECIPENLVCNYIYPDGSRCKNPKLNKKEKCKMHINYIPNRPKRKGGIVREKKLLKRIQNNRSAGEIYIFSLGFDNQYKVGLSRSGWESRFDALQAGNTRLKVVAVYAGEYDALALEKFIHYQLRKYNVMREIFILNDKQIQTIQQYLISKGYKQIK